VICIFGIELATLVLAKIIDSGDDGSPDFATTLFCVFAGRAVLRSTSPSTSDKRHSFNTLFSGNKWNYVYEVSDFGENPLNEYYQGTKSFTNDTDVWNDFDPVHFDYLTGFIAITFVVFMLVISIFMFVRRIFDLVLLYLISPFFAASIPLDGGEKFKAWKTRFIAVLVMGWGGLIGLQLWLYIIPMILSKKLVFIQDPIAGKTNGYESLIAQQKCGGSFYSDLNYVIKVLFLLGGAYAVWKSSSLFSTIIDMQAGGEEQAASGQFTKASQAVTTRIMKPAAAVGQVFGRAESALFRGTAKTLGPIAGAPFKAIGNLFKGGVNKLGNFAQSGGSGGGSPPSGSGDGAASASSSAGSSSSSNAFAQSHSPAPHAFTSAGAEPSGPSASGVHQSGTHGGDSTLLEPLLGPDSELGSGSSAFDGSGSSSIHPVHPVDPTDSGE
jgi:hypothetical protein